LAEAGSLVTFGIVAHRPETGYGYIRRGAAVGEGAFKVAAFVEKPALPVAEQYVASGDYDWNSGMFLFRASRYLAELQAHRPDILAACQKAMAAPQADMDFVRVDAEAFKACPDESIDYAVMEKTDAAVLVPMDAGWSDVGAFAA
jgi:mannose-1-phosphate guanylyltransferase